MMVLLSDWKVFRNSTIPISFIYVSLRVSLLLAVPAIEMLSRVPRISDIQYQLIITASHSLAACDRA